MSPADDKVDENTIQIVRYYDILRQIHTRLAIEGYFLPGGRIWNVFKFRPLDSVEIDYE